MGRADKLSQLNLGEIASLAQLDECATELGTWLDLLGHLRGADCRAGIGKRRGLWEEWACFVIHATFIRRNGIDGPQKATRLEFPRLTAFLPKEAVMGHMIEKKEPERRRQDELARALDRAGLELSRSAEGLRAIRIKPAMATRAPRRRRRRAG